MRKGPTGPSVLMLAPLPPGLSTTRWHSCHSPSSSRSLPFIRAVSLTHLGRGVRPSGESLLGGLDGLENLVLGHVGDIANGLASSGVWASARPLLLFTRLLPLSAPSPVPQPKFRSTPRWRRRLTGNGESLAALSRDPLAVNVGLVLVALCSGHYYRSFCGYGCEY